MMLEINNITHWYGRKQALQSIQFTATSGIIGLLGRNGAGKSTLLRILATLLKPTTGKLVFDGMNTIYTPEALRRAAAYVPQDMAFPPQMSARTYLRYLLALRGDAVDTVDFWLTQLGLGDVADVKLGKYSGGMRQRAGLAYALACNARILLLDEPTQGLDPWERTRFHIQLAQLAVDRLILFSTHIVSDIEAVANRIIVLDQGTLRYDGVPAALTEHAGAEPAWVVQTHEVWQPPCGCTVTMIRRCANGALETRGVGHPVPPNAIQVTRTLEDTYLRMTDTASQNHRLNTAVR